MPEINATDQLPPLPFLGALLSLIMADARTSTGKQKPNSTNGGQCEKYNWSQTLSEVTVHIPVTAGTTPKSIKCTLSDSKVKMFILDKLLIQGELFAEIREDESFWQLDRADNVVTLYLEKKDNMNWWATVIKGDEEIDVSCIDPGHSRLGDLDGETRGMVEKMMYDQRQKAAGKPTSDEEQKMAMFEKFKQDHPEMDFSNAKFH